MRRSRMDGVRLEARACPWVSTATHTSVTAPRRARPHPTTRSRARSGALRRQASPPARAPAPEHLASCGRPEGSGGVGALAAPGGGDAKREPSKCVSGMRTE